MSSSRGGFFSLNRFLGKKNKNEKQAPASNLSKSQTLNRSSNDLQFVAPQNQIQPLPTAGHNAPFEQTFRITVCLPMGQLYVTRIGAKTKLIDLMDMICANKLLDGSKFEFTHPTNEMQVFDLDLTIGEVGLSEIKFAPKQYQTANRINVTRAQTATSASPYSSTNSLNSSDSSGVNSSLRSSTCQLPAAPNRKKRAAPRPPSQNSIPEDREQKSISILSVSKNFDSINEDSGEYKRPLERRNFHVSSPNLTTHHNNTSLQLSAINNSNDNDSSTDTSIGGSIDGRQTNGSSIKPLNRPLSMQYSQKASDEHEFKHHSRTSSETSDITRDSLPEPIPRQRLFVSKKKAPAPPPRTITAITSNKVPSAAPRSLLQDLSEEAAEAKKEQKIEPTTQKESIETAPVIVPVAKKLEISTNVSKVMLNVEDKPKLETDDKAQDVQQSNESHQLHKEFVFSQQIKQTQINRSTLLEKRSVSKTQINCSTDDEKLSKEIPNAKPKSISVVELNVNKETVLPTETNKINSNGVSKSIENIDQEDISEQVNAIIDEAAEIHEAKSKVNNELKTKTNGYFSNYEDDINNNGIACEPPSPVWNYKLPAPPTFADDQTTAETEANESESTSSAAESNASESKVETPIQPVLNENRTFDFHEYSDNSLPTSTISTSNTMETPSTGPESLITSDIEDGYKGNEMEKQRKLEITREEFIEHQFEFLSKHDKGDDTDDEKTFEKADIISSTMIGGKSNLSNSKIDQQNSKTNGSNSKTDVINELTSIITSNRLDSVIRSNDETTNEQVNSLKRSSLANFHIGAYSNGNHENLKTKNKSNNERVFKRYSSVDYTSSGDACIAKRDHMKKRASLTSALVSNDSNDSEAIIASPKQVSRSMSFHSTFSVRAHRNENADESPENSSLASRSTSYISLIGNKLSTGGSGFNEKTRQKSNSELSIADSPSLQSIEILKSILSSSRTMSLPKKPLNEENETVANKPNVSIETEKPQSEPIKKSNEIENENKEQTNTNGNTSSTAQQSKTWKYQGPPSINLSTWGERPKSQVYIKSDTDYIFGGVSKMAALQKRFSAVVDEPKKVAANGNSQNACTIDSCKLPVVRGFEYKKNVRISNGNDAKAENAKPENAKTENQNDSTDSTADSVTLRTSRPSYEVSRLVCEKSFAEKATAPYKTMTLDRGRGVNKIPEPIPPKPFSNVNGNAKFISEQRVSFNGNQTKLTNGNGNVAHRNELNDVVKSYGNQTNGESAKPAFTQFKLRKTGLKEKFLDESNNNHIDNSNSNSTSDSIVSNNNIKNINLKPVVQNEVKKQATNIPLPPPILKKPLITSKPAAVTASAEPRDDLLDSIRNFKRDTLKRSRIV